MIRDGSGNCAVQQGIARRLTAMGGGGENKRGKTQVP
jgi:hypothetical protein